MPSCIKWGELRQQECSETADRGYDECTESRDEGYRDCCDWWPCSWACKAWTWISNIVCVVWTWVSNVVCVAWTWITTFFCVLWDIVTTVVNAVLGTLESIFGWVLSAIAFVIELLEMIPIVGALIRWVINFVTFLINTVLSLGDALLGLLGIRPEKKLRLCARARGRACLQSLAHLRRRRQSQSHGHRGRMRPHVRDRPQPRRSADRQLAGPQGSRVEARDVFLRWMMRNETVFEHPSQLHALHMFPPLRTPGLGVLRLGGEMARHENGEKWQRELNRSYHACGCDTGAKGLLIGLLAGLIAAAIGSGPWLSWPAAGIVFGSALAGAAVGKIIGLARAQIRLTRTVREITAEVRPHEPSVADVIACG